MLNTEKSQVVESGLSVGAIIGIVIGVFIFIGICGFIVYRKLVSFLNVKQSIFCILSLKSIKKIKNSNKNAEFRQFENIR